MRNSFGIQANSQTSSQKEYKATIIQITYFEWWIVSNIIFSSYEKRIIFCLRIAAAYSSTFIILHVVQFHN